MNDKCPVLFLGQKPFIYSYMTPYPNANTLAHSYIFMQSIIINTLSLCLVQRDLTMEPVETLAAPDDIVSHKIISLFGTLSVNENATEEE